MQYKKEEGNSSTSMRMQCSSCVHHEKTPAPGNGNKTCIKEGVLGSGAACSSYMEDTYQLVELAPRVIESLQRVAADLDKRAMQVLAMTIRNIENVVKAKFQPFQQVYFRIGEDFLQNYFSGYVLSVTKNLEFVYIGAQLGPVADNTFLTLMKESVLTPAQFEKRKRKLVKDKKVVEPRKRGKPTIFEELTMPRAEWKAHREKLATKPAEYVPPTVDTVPGYWLDKRRAPTLKPEVVNNIKRTVKQSKRTLEKRDAQKEKAKAKLVIAKIGGAKIGVSTPTRKVGSGLATRGKDGSISFNRHA